MYVLKSWHGKCNYTNNQKQIMQFRTLKRLAFEVKVEVEEPIFSFGEWELPFYAFDGYDFNGQFTGSSFFVDDYEGKLTKGEVIDMAWELIKFEAEEITKQ